MWAQNLLTLYGGEAVGDRTRKLYSRYVGRGGGWQDVKTLPTLYGERCDVGRGSVVCERRTLLVKTFPKFTKFPKFPTNKETLESLVRKRTRHKNKPQTPLRMTAVI